MDYVESLSFPTSPHRVHITAVVAETHDVFVSLSSSTVVLVHYERGIMLCFHPMHRSLRRNAKFEAMKTSNKITEFTGVERTQYGDLGRGPWPTSCDGGEDLPPLIYVISNIHIQVRVAALCFLLVRADRSIFLPDSRVRVAVASINVADY